MEKVIVAFACGVGFWGLVTLLRGVAVLWPLPMVRGIRVRLIGLTAMSPLPLAWLLGRLWSFVVVGQGWRFTLEHLIRRG